MTRIGIRADGDKEIGLGHIFQQIQLAKYLKKKLKADIYFVTKGSDETKLVSKEHNNFEWHFLPKKISCIDSIEKYQAVSDKETFDVAIFDITDPYPPMKENNRFFKVIKSMKEKGILTIGMEFISTEDYRTDVVINPSVVKHWLNYRTSEDVIYYLGPEYVILEPIYLQLNERERTISKEVKRIFVCLGGSDKNNVTGKVLDALASLDLDIDIEVVLGPLHPLTNGIPKIKHVFNGKVNFHNVSWRSWEYMIGCDLAITSAGRMPYELCATGTPSVIIPIVDHQIQTAKAFKSLGATVTLDPSFKNKEFEEIIVELSRDVKRRKKMSEQGKKIVDGKGLSRIYEIITSSL